MQTKRLAICIRGGGLGDLVLSLPALFRLQRAGYRINLWGNPRYQQLITPLTNFNFRSLEDRRAASLFSGEGHPELKELLEEASLILVWRRHPDLPPVPWLQYNFPEKTICLQSPEAFATSRDSGIDQPLWLYFLEQLFEKLPSTISKDSFISGDIFPRYPLSAKAERQAAGLHGKQPFAVLVPDSGATKKNWPAIKFLELGKYLKKKGLEVLVLLDPGKPQEEHEAFHCLEIFSVIRLKELDTIAGLIAKARILVGNDTGLSHLASLIDTPSLILYGPSDPILWQAPGPTSTLTSPRPCAPCGLRQMQRCDLPCMDSLSVQGVREAADTLLAAIAE